ncbi:MAG: hypothetical protein LBQ79_06950 [Deltaproteobacteria bacterium]|nr:hypothetical protein [Deltaproteobacteria bacterium]
MPIPLRTRTLRKGKNLIIIGEWQFDFLNRNIRISDSDTTREKYHALKIRIVRKDAEHSSSQELL